MRCSKTSWFPCILSIVCFHKWWEAAITEYNFCAAFRCAVVGPFVVRLLLLSLKIAAINLKKNIWCARNGVFFLLNWRGGRIYAPILRWRCIFLLFFSDFRKKNFSQFWWFFTLMIFCRKNLVDDFLRTDAMRVRRVILKNYFCKLFFFLIVFTFHHQ